VTGGAGNNQYYPTSSNSWTGSQPQIMDPTKCALKSLALHKTVLHASLATTLAADRDVAPSIANPKDKSGG
jgi:hypothetical protein